MNPEQQRIAIAEACGHGKSIDIRAELQAHSEAESFAIYNDRRKPECIIPDYLNDLNAMHEAEEKLSLGAVEDFSIYCSWLKKVVQAKEAIPYDCWITKATAAQRAEAFLKALNLWENNE